MSGTVLVTGASGFIGRHAASSLAQHGYEVIGVSRGSTAPELSGVRWREADLLDEAATRRLVREVRPRFLLHLAWYVEPGKFYESPLNREWLAASKVLLDEFMSCSGERVVIAGTVSEYENAPGVCRDTVDAPEPRTPYAKAKYELLQHVAAMRAGAASWAWGRVFSLYGPHEKPGRLVSTTIAKFLRGERLTVKSGKLVRDYSHVADVGAALAAMLASAVAAPGGAT